MTSIRQTAVALSLGAIIALVAAVAPATTAAQGQSDQDQTNVGTLLSGLVNVNVQDINVEDVQVVNVEDSLNENDVRILNNVLNNNQIASDNQNVLNNLLRDADIITDNQVVVGVNILSGSVHILDLEN